MGQGDPTTVLQWILGLDENNSDIMNALLMSDKAHLHVPGYV